jgi:hypothetical protein
VIVSPKYFRVTNAKAGTITYGAAPDWKIITYNQDRKVYFVTDAAKFTGRFAFFTGSYNRTNLGGLKFAPATLEHKDGVALRKYYLATAMDNRTQLADEQVWKPVIEVVEDRSLPRQAAAVLCRLASLPVLDSIPYSASGFVLSERSGRKLRVMLRTTAISRCTVQSGMDPSLKGFKLVKGETEFANENNNTMDLKDLTDYIGPH